MSPPSGELHKTVPSHVFASFLLRWWSPFRVYPQLLASLAIVRPWLAGLPATTENVSSGCDGGRKVYRPGYRLVSQMEPRSTWLWDGRHHALVFTGTLSWQKTLCKPILIHLHSGLGGNINQGITSHYHKFDPHRAKSRS